MSILDFAKEAYRLARRVLPSYSSRFSKKTYTLPQHAVILCLKVREGKTYRGIKDMLSQMPALREAIGLRGVPCPSGICRAFERLKAAVWRVLMRLTRQFFDLSGIAAIDSSGEERDHFSLYYTRRSKLHIKELKVTLLVDVRDNVISDVSMTTTRKHDVKIGEKIVKRSADQVKVLIGDKGFDDSKLRILCKGLRIRPMIKHREFGPIQRAWNKRMEKRLYAQRNQCESVKSSISRKYGSYLRSKKWYKQFREFLVKCSVYNLDRALQLK